MALQLNEIDWSAPILPVVDDAAWEAEARGAAGSFGDVYRRTTPSVWLRRAMLAVDTQMLPLHYIPNRLCMIGVFVVAQENACRYCYGAARSYMRMIGFSEAQVSRIERDTWLTELDEKERAFFQFCRNLARSKPRPAQAEREHLLEVGYSPQAVAEMAFLIAVMCFYQRVTTFIACEPAARLERFPDTIPGRLLSLAGGLVLRMMMRQMKAKQRELPAIDPSPGTMFNPVLAALEGVPRAALLQQWLHEAFASPVLSRQTKALIFAVVARSLECALCEGEARKILESCGLSPAEIDRCLDTLESSRLDAVDALLLPWARDTVHYEPHVIQQRTRALAGQIGNETLLEAIGVAALANCTVRLAMLLA